MALTPCLTRGHSWGTIGMTKSIVVTGGAGFIGAHVVRYLTEVCDDDIVIIDKLSYAGHLGRLSDVLVLPRVHFYQEDVCNTAKMSAILAKHQPWAIMHLAAESHVDRSIDAPTVFLHNNIQGTQSLLQAALGYWQALPDDLQAAFRYLQVSTDEVFGDAEDNGYAAHEDSPYRPSSPYSASKASADHWVQSYQRTFGLPTLISYCSNNYGPGQFPEKLIPLSIERIKNGETIPVYGDGLQKRDWLYVVEHARALWLMLTKAEPNQCYVVAAGQPITNLQLLQALYLEVQKQLNRPVNEVPIQFVTDRLGHDRCYSLDASKIKRELGWHEQTLLQDGLAATVHQALNAPLLVTEK